MYSSEATHHVQCYMQVRELLPKLKEQLPKQLKKTEATTQCILGPGNNFKGQWTQYIILFLLCTNTCINVNTPCVDWDTEMKALMHYLIL